MPQANSNGRMRMSEDSEVSYEEDEDEDEEDELDQDYEREDADEEQARDLQDMLGDITPLSVTAKDATEQLDLGMTDEHMSNDSEQQELSI